ncbi:MAG: hypothetical protein ACI97A_003560 [Planctomycetota bacterium]|jgi:hypothetical protein
MISKSLLIIIAGCLLVLPSCGYSTNSLMPSGVDRIAVDVFGNDTFYREIEFQLTREITAEINHRAALRVSRRRNADAVLTGKIVSVSRPTMVETRNNLVSEQAVLVTAAVELRSVATGKLLANFVLANRAEFVVERGESLQSAFDEALKDLAEDIINELERQSYHSDLEKVRAKVPE